MSKKINTGTLKMVLEQQTGSKVVLEHRFHPKRKWRFDLAIPDKMIGIELEGGVWTRGRHTRGKGFIEDCNKYNAASVLGWTILRYTHSGHSIGNILSDVEKLIEIKPKQ